MPKQWRFASHDQAIVGRLAEEMSCSPLLAQVLAARGVTTKNQADSLYSTKMTDLHDPGLLPGVSEAADRVVSAINAKRRITIYGDYDVDGVTATSILWHCLKLAGAQVDYYIPCRLEEGYGLNLEAIQTLYDEDPERLVITVDCGISSLEEAALAKSLGLELIITDHHTLADQLPAAATNVHPRLPGSEYPFPDLCGAGVAFKLAWAICQKLGDGTKASPRMREYLKAAVGLAAMGTVADVVPLVGENRILVRYGLSTIVEKSMTGLAMLLKVAGLDSQNELSAEDIGFGLAPRINAAGRLGQARLAVELLTTENRQRAAQLADYVDQLNKNRQTVERKMYREAKEMVEENPDWLETGSLVLASEDWHPGVIGIVASRIAEKFERPAVMIAMNSETRIGQGSGRSFNGFDLHSGLSHCSEYLEAFGGHRAAAGLRISADRIDEFREVFGRYVSENQSSESEEPELAVDAEISLHDLTNKAVKELDWLGPFGQMHRRPIFSSSRVELVEAPGTMGGGGRHLALKVREGSKIIRAVAFGKGDWAEEMVEEINGPFSICFSASINRFRGYENVELQLIDWKPSSSQVASKAV
ncbi:single-stranded-DNA-specific exonuclease RecJ [Thalassoglobus sp. JC818]|uniref:single-stranded-DNA-specific exonuclease RecJ n=1 Tax=Thalassoglobus sp. JC818 TaxID=3232136 RepID=UPI00345B2E42